ncbi:MAG: hypothetical protein LWX02_12375 [Deltaproteobacteria bacterium]|nr:hypothetical protein [Deltaproteobacteria bacterium]MDL1988934.1 hypothetical protein [Deltaproteobacteria bacterium]MDL2122746.1 hypothetical protein [Deltaproteobacteria bacterium]
MITGDVSPHALRVGDESQLSDYRFGVCNGASGIYYNRELWGFYPSRSKVIRYRRLSSNGSWGEDKEIIPSITTKYIVSPVIFRERLFVFFVGINKNLYYTIYKGNDEWESIYECHIQPEAEVAPIYNPQTNILEVYFKKRKNIIYIYYDGCKWWPGKNGSFHVRKDLYTDSAPSAEVVENSKGNYRIMLAHRSFNDDQIHIDFLKNKYQISDKCKTGYFLKEDKTKNSPHLVNLGNGSIALLYRGLNDRVYVRFYDEAKQNWGETKECINKETCFNVRGAAYYTPYQIDTTVEEGLKGYLMVFWSNREHILKDPHLIAYQAKYLGKWKKEVENTEDWSQIKDESIWDLYPVVGIIDVPPFVLNGGTIQDNRTEVTFKHSKEETDTTEWKLKAGIYAETGKQSPVNCEVNVGLTKEGTQSTSISTSVSYSFSMSYLYPPKSLNQHVSVIYLAPITKVTTYKFYTEEGTSTDKELVVVEITGAHLLSHPCGVTNFKNLPKRALGDLRSYNNEIKLDNYDSDSMSTGASWDSNSKTKVSFALNETKTKSTGGYISIKVGKEIAGIIGAGFEGEFSIKYEQTTKIKDSFFAFFKNPAYDNDREGDISSFNTNVYWLWMKPEEWNGYWIPDNRQQTGDRPWFITFIVGNYSNKFGAVESKITAPKEIIPAVENGGPKYIVIDGIERPIKK